MNTKLVSVIFFFCIWPSHCLKSSLPAPIDLSHSLSEQTPHWNGEDQFRLFDQVNVSTPDGSFYATNKFVGAEHGGTHLDAPYHFKATGWKVDDIPIDRLLSKGILIDVSDLVNDSNFELLPIHLEEWEKKYGSMPQNATILIKFGWSSRYPDRIKYFGRQSHPYSFPGISAEAAQWIVNTTKIVGVGVDTPSTDAGRSTTFPTHKILSAANIYGIENVAIDKVHLPAKGFDLIVLPLKIKDGSGAPCRIVAI